MSAVLVMMCTASAATSAGENDAPDGERGAKLIAAVVELVAEERCRQRCVDEAGGDEVDSNGREFEREAGGEGGQRSGESRDESESLSRAAATSPPHEEESSSRANLVCGVTSDLQRQKQMGLNIPVRLFKIELGQGRVIGAWASNQHVVDRSGQFVEEPREAVRVGSIKGHQCPARFRQCSRPPMWTQRARRATVKSDRIWNRRAAKACTL